MKSEDTWLIEFSPGETRAALIDGRDRLMEMQIERMGESEIVGSIHLGRITRVEKGIGAAFVTDAVEPADVEALLTGAITA